MSAREINNDFELIGRIQAGEKEVYRVLVDRYKDVSYTLALSVLHESDDAADAVQNAFIKAYRSLPGFKFRSSFASWLYRIVYNCSIDLYKKRNERANGQTYKTEMHGNDSESYLYKKESGRLIDELLSKMKPEEALLLRLYYLAELDTEEIGTVTGFGNSKIKTGLHRARKSMMELYNKTIGKEKIYHE